MQKTLRLQPQISSSWQFNFKLVRAKYPTQKIEVKIDKLQVSTNRSSIIELKI